MTGHFEEQLAELAQIQRRDALFLMACSERKVETVLPVPLLELYDGPTWQTMRTHAWEGFSGSQVLVLSGKFGWASGMTHSVAYNERISPQKVDALVARGANGQERTSKGLITGWTPVQLIHRFGEQPWRAVVACGGKEYRRAFDAVIPELVELGYIDATAPIVKTEGGIGDQRGQLGQILRTIGTSLEYQDERSPFAWN